jgi:hypothetical protein
MGQQQLLLLVLGIVIVGIAILVGINAYSENSVKSNWDSMLQDALRIASDAQAWKSKPELFGGSPDTLKADSDNFTGLDFLQMAYAGARVSGTNNDCYQNLNGDYEITPGTTNLAIEATNVPNQNRIIVNVNGTLEANVSLTTVDAENVKGGKDAGGSDATVTAAC